MTRIVVLHVLEALETGCARHLVDLVRHTDGVSHEVAVPARRVGGVTDTAAVGHIRDAGGVVHIIDMRRSPLHARNAVALAKLATLVRRRQPSVVHGHSSIGGVLARLAAIGSPAARVYTPNGLAAGRAATTAERGLGRLTDRLVAVSESERDEVLRRRLVAPGRVTMIPNGITLDPLPHQDLRALIGVGPEVALIGTMGRLSPQKNPKLVIEAFALVASDARRGDHDPHFVVIGDGPLAAEVERAIAAAGIADRLHWLRELPEAARYLHDLDVFVLGSRFEGGPYAPLEAMRAGVAVVVTDVVGSHDVVEHGVSGLLVPDGDARALAASVRTLLDDVGQRRRLVVAGRARLRRRFDVERSGAATRALYEALVLGASGTGRRAS